MKRKALIAFMSLCLSLTIGLSITACGKQTQQQTQAEPTEQKEETEQSEKVYNTETNNNEVTDNIVYPDVNPEDVDPKTTNMDAETATALAQQEGKEIDAQYGSEEAWTGYAQSQGADGTLGWCWIYYTGQGAGDQESYAVYMKEDSPRYGEVFHLGDYLPGGDFFVGANNKEHGIADVRVGQRQVENGELDGVTFDEDGTVHIVVE